jgi:hypothetical protein
VTPARHFQVVAPFRRRSIVGVLDDRLDVPLANRADLLTLMGMLPEVEAWRETLPETQQQHLTRPVSVLAAYRRATVVKPACAMPPPAGQRNPNLRD